MNWQWKRTSWRVSEKKRIDEMHFFLMDLIRYTTTALELSKDADGEREDGKWEKSWY